MQAPTIRPAREPTVPEFESGHPHGFHLPRFRWIVVAGLAAVMLLWVVPVLIEAVGSLQIEVNRPYLLIFTFVAFDAVIPLFPSESLLHVASGLAAQDKLTLGDVILAAGAGAVVGDSLLYWISRSIARTYLSAQLGRAKKNEKVAVAFDVLGQSAPALIVLGRFVVGVRFAVNATMGITQYPYPRFLLYSVIGGFGWAAYTCVISYWTSEALSGYPLLSILTGIILTTVILAVLYIVLKRRYDRDRGQPTGAAG
jgi:membrane protein DedA with SNARE-associated domain